MKRHQTTCKEKKNIEKNILLTNNNQLQMECKFLLQNQNILEEKIHKYEQQIQFLTQQHQQDIQTQQKQYEEKLEQQQKQYEKQIEKLELQNKELHNQLFDIAKQPKQNTIHNNNSNNTNQRTLNITNQLALYDLTEESIRSIVNEHFNEDVFNGGIEKIKKLVVDKILMNPESKKPKILMTDASRQNCKYLTNSGEVKTDLGCEKTYNLIKDPLLDRNEQICIDLVDNQNEREIRRRIYDQHTKNENSIKNKNQFLKKLFVEEN